MLYFKLIANRVENCRYHGLLHNSLITSVVFLTVANMSRNEQLVLTYFTAYLSSEIFRCRLEPVATRQLLLPAKRKVIQNS